MLKTADPNPQGSIILHRLPHLQQASTWDCGVTCVLMLLDEEPRHQALANLSRLCDEEGFGQSTWTIDLCYLLNRFGIPHRMFTTKIGVNEAHRDHKYYTHIIDKDRERVASRFAASSAQGLTVIQGLLGTRALAAHLAGGPAGGLAGGPAEGRPGGPALLLVNGALLDCDRCRRNKLRAELRRWFGAPYSGHYILLVGYDSKRNRFFYLDPARAPCPGPGHMRNQTPADLPPAQDMKLQETQLPDLTLAETQGLQTQQSPKTWNQGDADQTSKIPDLLLTNKDKPVSFNEENQELNILVEQDIIKSAKYHDIEKQGPRPSESQYQESDCSGFSETMKQKPCSLQNLKPCSSDNQNASDQGKKPDLNAQGTEPGINNKDMNPGFINQHQNPVGKIQGTIPGVNHQGTNPCANAEGIKPRVNVQGRKPGLNVQIPCVLGAGRLRAAAAAPGTDHDVILIDRSYR